MFEANRGVDAGHDEPAAHIVGGGSAAGLSGPACPVGEGGRAAGRPGVLRALPAAFLGGVGTAVDPDRDVPADDVPQTPVRAGLRDAVWGGRGLADLDAVCRIPLGSRVP